MSDTQAATPAQDVLDKAVAEGGAYEVLHKRLLEQGQRLRQTAERLNASRLEEFGDSQMDVIGRVRIRTENNCIARDIVQVGDCLLFGYNVFIGLRKETGVADVFSLYRLVEGSEGYEAEPVPLGDSFLAAPGFVNDFNELYTYYKNTRLLQLAIRDGKLLASFQIGERITDIRVFRWSISSDGSEVRYIDNRGERDIALPAPFDFEWQRATREMVVEGRFPHLNILDTLFVETIGGDLTIKVENNTEVGLGIYREEVMDKTQSLDDAQVEFARLGSLLLLKVLPYREEQWRYLVFNSLTGKVERIDAIGLACIQLPEDHGIIFPGGYYLQNGEYRTFEQSMEGMRFKRSVRSPNGEDVQYVFYHPEQGRNVLLTYNLINRQLQNPLFGHGYARLEDGRMVIFAAEGEEPTRIHPMQVWQTPFCTEEHAARQPARGGDRRAGARRVREGRKYPPPVGPGDGRRGGAAQGAPLRLAARRLGPGAAVRRRAQRHHRPAWVAADHPRVPLHRRGATRRHGGRTARGPRAGGRRHRNLPRQRTGPAALAGAPAEPRWRGAESRDRGPARRAAGGPGGDGRRPRHAVLADGFAAHRRRDPADPHHRVDLGDLRPPEPGQGARRAAAQGTRFERDRGPVRRPVQTVRPGHHQRPGPGPGPRALRRATVAPAGATGGTGKPVRRP